ncbi:MAG: DUF2237 domain-containing protein [Verrucomicrobiota bacterium]
MAENIFGEALEPCGFDPKTGFFRDGYCHTCGEDTGQHTVCAVLTAEFLQFSRARGNDLETPRPEFQFPGLKPGDRWCLCLGRWIEAREAGKAPQVVPRATHLSVLEFLDREELEPFFLSDEG